jgi:hypothetical protein
MAASKEPKKTAMVIVFSFFLFQGRGHIDRLFF